MTIVNDLLILLLGNTNFCKVFLPLSFVTSIFGMNATEFGVIEFDSQFRNVFYISAAVVTTSFLLAFNVPLIAIIASKFRKLQEALYRRVVGTTSDHKNAVEVIMRGKAGAKATSWVDVSSSIAVYGVSTKQYSVLGARSKTNTLNKILAQSLGCYMTCPITYKSLH